MPFAGSALVAASLALVVPSAAQQSPTRIMRKETIVAAPVREVWAAWTTEEGLTFVSPRSRVELRPGGPYELFLDGPPDTAGRRGAEGSRVLAFLPEAMIAFDWTFPPAVPSLRMANARTQVVILFDEAGPGQTRVRLSVLGWQEGPEWDKGWEYFDTAWTYVLDALTRKYGNAR